MNELVLRVRTCSWIIRFLLPSTPSFQFSLCPFPPIHNLPFDGRPLHLFPAPRSPCPPTRQLIHRPSKSSQFIIANFLYLLLLTSSPASLSLFSIHCPIQPFSHTSVSSSVSLSFRRFHSSVLCSRPPLPARRAPAAAASATGSWLSS